MTDCTREGVVAIPESGRGRERFVLNLDIILVAGREVRGGGDAPVLRGSSLLSLAASLSTTALIKMYYYYYIHVPSSCKGCTCGTVAFCSGGIRGESLETSVKATSKLLVCHTDEMVINCGLK